MGFTGDSLVYLIIMENKCIKRFYLIFSEYKAIEGLRDLNFMIQVSPMQKCDTIRFPVV